MKHILKITALSLALIFTSCDSLDFDANLDNPNEVGPSNLDRDLLMNKILLEFGSFMSNASDPTMELVRMRAMTGGDTYENAYQPQANPIQWMWRDSYRLTLSNVETLLANVNGTGFSAHAGVAKVIKAWTYITLVDLYGDVPYSEAIKGAEGNFNPKADKGSEIYTKCIALLDEAIADLAKTPIAGVTRDIYYGGNRTNWTAAANTLKLKAWMNLRLTNPTGAKTAIDALLASNIIDTDAEEFTYKYGTSDVPQRSRNPRYYEMYDPTAGLAGGYLGNYFMYTLYRDKGVPDPRWRYYFFRQVGSIAKAVADEPETVECRLTPRPEHIAQNQSWCAFDPGFFGRDHGNGDGVPPDTRAVTCFGVYPFGGRIDINNGNAQFASVTQLGQGANGAGIEPIWMANFTDFVKAEAALTLGTAGDPKALLESGIKKSIARVKKFAADKGQTNGLTADMVTPDSTYLNIVMSRFDSGDKLQVVGKEYYVALWGNGVEAYNLYRRTGAPANPQPTRALNGGNFPRSLIYPAVYANLNSNATQKVDNKVKVFWDNNPDGFVK